VRGNQVELEPFLIVRLCAAAKAAEKGPRVIRMSGLQVGHQLTEEGPRQVADVALVATLQLQAGAQFVPVAHYVGLPLITICTMTSRDRLC